VACKDSSSPWCRLGTWKACLSELIESLVELWLLQCKVPQWRRAGVADVPCNVASTEQRSTTKLGMKTTRLLRTVCETDRSRRLHAMEAKSTQFKGTSGVDAEFSLAAWVSQTTTTNSLSDLDTLVKRTGYAC